MAKGDDKRVRNQIEYQGGLAQNNLGNLRQRTLEQQPMFQDNYKDAVTRQLGDYGNLMGGYKEFAKTGGFSPQDMSNMRARGNASNRALFQTGQRGIERQRALQGGYSPGATAALSRLQRDTGQAMSDTNVNTEANLAQMRQQGKLAGLSGGSQLYGTTPGQANMFGNQLLANMNQQGDIERQQQGLSLGLIDAQQNAARIPGKWEQNMSRVNDVISLAGKGAEAWSHLPGKQSPITNTASPSMLQGLSQGAPASIASQGVSQGLTPSVSTAYSTGLPASSPGGIYGPSAVTSQNLTQGLGGAALQGGKVAGLTGGTSTALANTGGGLTAGLSQGAPAAISSQGVSGATGASGATGGGMGSAAAAAAPFAGMYLTKEIVDKGLFRGGAEGTQVNPARDNFFKKVGGPEGMIQGLARQGIVGEQANALITEVNNAKTMQQWHEIRQKLASLGYKDWFGSNRSDMAYMPTAEERFQYFPR